MSAWRFCYLFGALVVVGILGTNQFLDFDKGFVEPDLSLQERVERIRSMAPTSRSHAQLALHPEFHLVLNEYARYFGLPEWKESDRSWMASFQSEKVWVAEWGGEAAQRSVFVASGYMDHIGYLAPVIHAFRKAGFRVIAWDWVGQGLSTGARGDVADFSKYSDVFRRIAGIYAARAPSSKPTKFWYFGHSTGAVPIIDQLSERQRFDLPLNIEQALLLAPLLKLKALSSMPVLLKLAQVFGWPGISRQFAGLVRDYDQHLIGVIRSDPVLVREVRASWAKAYLDWYHSISASAGARSASAETSIARLRLLHGVEDDTVDGSFSEEWLKHFGDKFSAHWFGGGHQPHNEVSARVRFLEVFKVLSREPLEP